MTIAIAALLMSSCGIYNKYHRPEVESEGLIRDIISPTDTLVSNDTTSFGNLPWREVFTDPQLQSLIEKGLNGNVDLLNAALNVKIVEAQLMAARLAFLPQLTFSPSGAVTSWNHNKATQTYSLPINASWNIDLFGNLLNQKRSTQMALLATKDYQVVVQTNIICNIANMYYTLLMLDRQLEILDDMIVLTKNTWDLMKLQKELGRYRETSVLSLLVGQPAQQIARGNIDDQNLPTEFSTGVALQLLANRADVHAAEMQLASCFYDVQTARSRFYPSINISGSGAFTNNSGAGIVNPGKILANAVASLTQPIFMRGQLIAGLKVAKAQQEQAYNTWQNSIFKAANEVSNSLVLYNSSKAKADIEAEQVEVLKKNVEDTKALVSQSTSTYLEVIQAQSSLLNAEISKTTDDFYKMQAIVSLYQALGGGRK